MHIKFLARGTGSGRDATGQPREGAEVLCGNPDKVAAVADSLDFEHRYTSGVIAWAPEKQPTDEQIEAVLDAFEETAWAGLEPETDMPPGPPCCTVSTAEAGLSCAVSGNPTVKWRARRHVVK